MKQEAPGSPFVALDGFVSNSSGVGGHLSAPEDAGAAGTESSEKVPRATAAVDPREVAAREARRARRNQNLRPDVQWTEEAFARYEGGIDADVATGRLEREKPAGLADEVLAKFAAKFTEGIRAELAAAAGRGDGAEPSRERSSPSPEEREALARFARADSFEALMAAHRFAAKIVGENPDRAEAALRERFDPKDFPRLKEEIVHGLGKIFGLSPEDLAKK